MQDSPGNQFKNIFKFLLDFFEKIICLMSLANFTH